MSEVLRKEIRSAFADAGLRSVNDKVLSECMALSTTNAVSPLQLAETWEAHSLNKNITELTENTFSAYRNAVLKDVDSAVIMTRPLKRTTNQLPTVTPPAKKLQLDQSVADFADNNNNSRRVSVSPNQLVKTSATEVSTPVMKPAVKLPSYAERTNIGKVMASYQPKSAAAAAIDFTPATEKQRCQISTDCFSTNVQKPYRHMFTPLEERAKILDQQLCLLGEEIMKNHDSSGSELEAVGVPRQDKVTCVGRICNEAHEGRINATSILLEGTRQCSNGNRISVDLSHLKETNTPYSFFPGQIVAVEGINVSGRKIVAHRLLEGAPQATKKTTAANLMKYNYDLQDGKPIKIINTCGPYTTSGNVDYAPLMDLIEQIRVQKPDVVIMAGPFVSVSNANTQLDTEDESKLMVSFEVFFANKFSGLLEELFETEPDLQTQFVLVPSMDDAVAEWAFPQAPFADRGVGKEIQLPGAEGIEVASLGLGHVERAGRASAGPKRVHCVPNPCTLCINEVVIGITSNDVIFHMSADETNGALVPGSRLSRIAEHLVQQRSYYPLFPPASGVNLDLKQQDGCSMPCRPDVLICPSKLTSFTRAVCGSTMAVNPGFLTKGTTGGTYAVMTFQPIARDLLDNASDDQVELEHAIQDRVSIEIRKI